MDPVCIPNLLPKRLLGCESRAPLSRWWMNYSVFSPVCSVELGSESQWVTNQPFRRVLDYCLSDKGKPVLQMFSLGCIPEATYIIVFCLFKSSLLLQLCRFDTSGLIWDAGVVHLHVTGVSWKTDFRGSCALLPRRKILLKIPVGAKSERPPLPHCSGFSHLCDSRMQMFCIIPTD